MLLFQFLLGLHELSDPHWDVGEDIFGWIRNGPIRFAAPAVVVHAGTGRMDFCSGPVAHLLRRPWGAVFGLGLLESCGPLLHVIPEVIPNAMNAATHTAIIRLLGPRGNRHSVHGFPSGLRGRVPGIVARGTTGASQSRPKNDRHFVLGRLRLDGSGGGRFHGGLARDGPRRGRLLLIWRAARKYIIVIAGQWKGLGWCGILQIPRVALGGCICVAGHATERRRRGMSRMGDRGSSEGQASISGVQVS